MEKENYETYEYLPASEGTSAAEPYQFFVVQDDGTFLINRQVQYVTQVEANKESEEGQPCTMLDVTPQQFFVDVDNAGEMTVPEQFNIPEGTNNLYTSSYLLQPGTAATIEQIDNNTEEQLKTNIQLDNSTPKQTNGLTEITITDEQYHLLEQKGWILLEINEKVYILDTFGLHDITTNDKLIQKLKADNTTDHVEPDPSQFKIEFLPLDDIDTESKGVQSEGKLEPTPETECQTDLSLIVDESKEEEKEQKPQRNENYSADAMQETGVDNLNQGCENWLKDGNVLRIRTDFCLKDIPDRIVLGKTKNGKRLVCRVFKPDINIKQARKTENMPASVKTVPIKTYQNDIPTCLNEIGDEKLDKIFRMCFQGSTVQYNDADVTLTDKVVRGLLKLPAVKSSIVNRNMLVTKVIVIEQKSLIIESSPTLVTGKVVFVNRMRRFVHKPYLYAIAKQELSQPLSENESDHNFLHMHLHEIQQDDKFVQLSVTLDKRRLVSSSTPLNSEKIFIPDMPLNLINDLGDCNLFTDNETQSKVRKESKRNLITDNETESKVRKESKRSTGSAGCGYACGICATVYETEKDLDEHRATHKTETDEKETEKTREMNFSQTGILVVTDVYTKTKSYACMQCKARFSRLSNCQRHINTHTAPADKEVSGDKKAYKCKICVSFFNHSSTLLKHMKSHIKLDK